MFIVGFPIEPLQWQATYYQSLQKFYSMALVDVTSVKNWRELLNYYISKLVSGIFTLLAGFDPISRALYEGDFVGCVCIIYTYFMIHQLE